MSDPVERVKDQLYWMERQRRPTDTAGLIQDIRSVLERLEAAEGQVERLDTANERHAQIVAEQEEEIRRMRSGLEACEHCGNEDDDHSPYCCLKERLEATHGKIEAALAKVDHHLREGDPYSMPNEEVMAVEKALKGDS